MNRRITNTILIVLLLLNAAFIGSWWMSRMHGRRMHMNNANHFAMGEDRGMDFLVKELKLDSVQKKQIESLWKEHSVKMSTYQTEITRYEKQTLDCMLQDTPDSTKAFAYADSAGMVRNAIHKELFRHLTKVRQLCNPDQKKEFDKVVKNMIMKVSHHHNMHPGAISQDSM